MQISTTRLTLIAANAEMAWAEIEDHAHFAALLSATIPADWPPESIADVLPWVATVLAAIEARADTTHDGWWNWYALAQDEGSATLVASVLFHGKPDADGEVEMGYAVLPAYQRRGYATEMVNALAQWALTQPSVKRIVADVLPDNEPSQRVLRGADFAFVGDSPKIDPDDPDADHRDHLRFERWRDGPVLTAKPFYLTSIPAKAVEKPSSWNTSSKDYFLNGDLVGRRHFDDDGLMETEVAYRNDISHGCYYTWDEGALSFSETYDAQGRAHGNAYQWAKDGRLIGSYELIHGTGIDLWWTSEHNGTAKLFEIHTLRDGKRHGYEWWLDENEVPFSERHWQNGLNGIEREWNDKGRLKRGFPRYWLHGQRVRKDRYVRAAAKDDTLPPFRAEENLPARQFPPEVEARRRLHAQESANLHG